MFFKILNLAVDEALKDYQTVLTMEPRHVAANKAVRTLPSNEFSKKTHSIPLHPEDYPRGINPPPTKGLVQGDQSPTYYGSSPAGSIPLQNMP